MLILVNIRMNSFKESYQESSKALKLIGSQVNLTPRLDQSVLDFENRRIRPCSATHSCRSKAEFKATDVRPKSADYRNLSPPNCKSIQWPLTFNESKVSENSLLTVSHFIDSSSKLLQNLIEHSEERVSVKISSFNRNFITQFKCPKLEEEIAQKPLEGEIKPGFLNTHCLIKGSEHQKSSQRNNIWLKRHTNLKSPIVKPEIPESKTVRFSERYNLDLQSEKELSSQMTFSNLKESGSNSSCVKNNFKPLWQERDICQRWTIRTPEKPKIIDLEAQRTDINYDFKGNVLTSKSSHTNTQNENLKNEEENTEETSSEQCEILSKDIKRMVENSKSPIGLPDFQKNIEMEKVETESKCKETSDTLTNNTGQEVDQDINEQVKINEKVASNELSKKINVSDSTYEEIVHLLQALDEEDSESLSSEKKQLAAATSLASPKEKIDYLCAVSDYLEELERDDNGLYEQPSNTRKWNLGSFSSPRLEELLNKNSVELAQEVLSLKIQIEDQKKGIKLLKDTLAELKETHKVEKLEHQEAVHKINSESEALVQRHQKFIKQLLNEKKNLNETVSKLVQDLKTGEERYKRNIKAMEEKHLIEIKKAKEVQAVADKIKREKWMENKTQKIKEMTVKGLEPELSRMAARQQEEITELRNLHKAELEALELRAARRNSELMDELRAELTKEKERAIAKEVACLRTTLEKSFEDEKNKLQQHSQNLKERIRKLEEALSNQELEFQQRLIDYKQEEEKKKQKMYREHQENLEEVQRQHSIELKHLKESNEVEKEVLLNNFKKQQATKNLERESELHQQYKRERDKEIELVIETLEKESTQIQSELNAANENKLKRLKNKMEAEIKEIEASEAALKIKLSEAKAAVSEKEDCITELNSQIRQLQTELTFVKKSCEEMSLQKVKLKEIIREEFECNINGLLKEKENLEKDIVVLKELHLNELAKKDQQNFQVKYEMQKELTKVYSRIKTAVSKKEKIIESLREENEAANQKCRQLEIMLDQQRRNLLLH